MLAFDTKMSSSILDLHKSLRQGSQYTYGSYFVRIFPSSLLAAAQCCAGNGAFPGFSQASGSNNSGSRISKTLLKSLIPYHTLSPQSSHVTQRVAVTGKEVAVPSLLPNREYRKPTRAFTCLNPGKRLPPCCQNCLELNRIPHLTNPDPSTFPIILHPA